MCGRCGLPHHSQLGLPFGGFRLRCQRIWTCNGSVWKVLYDIISVIMCHGARYKRHLTVEGYYT